MTRLDVSVGRRRSRELVRETRLDVADLVYTRSCLPGRRSREPARGADAIVQRSIDRLCDEAEEAHALGIRAVSSSESRIEDEEGSGAWDDEGIVQSAVRALRGAFQTRSRPPMCVCANTRRHGHCGVVEDGGIVNDLSWIC